MLEKILVEYFGSLADRFKLSNGTAAFGAFSFRERSSGGLEVVTFDDNPWLKQQSAVLPPDEFAWETVAYMKVRVFDTAEGVIKRAEDGSLYDEDYFLRRGGGSPYSGYPREASGSDSSDRFRALAREIRERMNPARVLDVGCATGLLVKALHDLGTPACGVDISEWAVSNAVTSDIYHGNVTSLPFPDDKFDFVISQDVMEHIRPVDLPLVMREQARVTKSGGRICHFIPFYPYLEPQKLDAHLCNANRAWWLDLIVDVPGFHLEQVPPKDDQWDFRAGQLSRYFIIHVDKRASVAGSTATRHHVVISGTGRAGTSFLVCLLTNLGLETGYKVDNMILPPIERAGFEADIRDSSSPYIVKSPLLCEYIDEVSSDSRISIDHAIVPMREFAAASASRAHVQEIVTGSPDGESAKVWGGLWGTNRAEEQEEVLRSRFSRLMEALARHDVPTTLLWYPRLVEDAVYLYRKLLFLFPGRDFASFLDVFDRVRRPELVHHFTATDA